VALIVALVEDEVAIGDAVDAHMHNGFVAHAHLHAALAVRAIATNLVVLPLFVRVAHAVLLVVVRLTAWALGSWMAEAFLGAL